MIVIKRLSLNGEIFLPQTSAEAVVVKLGEEILTLDKILPKKLEQIITPADSGLSTLKLDNQSVEITHTNKIIPSGNIPKLYKLIYNQTGHIISASPSSSLKITTINKECINFDGNENLELKLGDDFISTLDNTIKLNWNNI